jgi:hypothetical protein
MDTGVTHTMNTFEHARGRELLNHGQHMRALIKDHIADMARASKEDGHDTSVLKQIVNRFDDIAHVKKTTSFEPLALGDSHTYRTLLKRVQMHNAELADYLALTVAGGEIHVGEKREDHASADVIDMADHRPQDDSLEEEIDAALESIEMQTG